MLRINVRAPLVRRSFAEPGQHLSAKFPRAVLRYPLLHKRAHAQQQRTELFDHLVGKREQRRRQVQSECRHNRLLMPGVVVFSSNVSVRLVRVECKQEAPASVPGFSFVFVSCGQSTTRGAGAALIPNRLQLARFRRNVPLGGTGLAGGRLLAPTCQP